MDGIQEVESSILSGSTVTEAKAIAALVCDISLSGFESRQSPQMESMANGLATGFEHRHRLSRLGVRFLYSPPIENCGSWRSQIGRAHV